MYFFLSKVFCFFLFPATWIILLTVAGFMFRSFVIRRICRFGAVIVFFVFTNKPLLEYANYWSTSSYENHIIPSERVYDLGIVLGGFSQGINVNSGQIIFGERGVERLWDSLLLYKAGKVKYLLFTGDATSAVLSNGSDTSELFLNMLSSFGVSRKDVFLEQHAKNTRENAVLAQKMWQQAGISSQNVLLITSATHMKRSLEIFAQADIYPDYYPVRIYPKPKNVTCLDFIPSWSISIQWMELLKEWNGRLYVRLFKD